MGVTREKFGLSWLNPNAQRSAANDGPAQESAPSSRASQQVDAALLAVGVKVISKLNAAPGKIAGFNELPTMTGVNISQLLPVLSYLAELRWVEYVDDDKIKLTDEGAAQIS
ncbi:MAG TPA: hypothetical protein VF075_02740 [Pyrinomonadaceae bacterium]